MRSVRKPWWQQATALVTVTTGGVITGFNFVPGAAATMTTPTSVPLHLLALEQAGQPGAAMNARAVGGDSADAGTSDGLLRSAIVNVAKYYLQIAATRTPAQMEALIWDNTSLNGSDQGPSCAAFASLTLELAAQAVGQQSWVTGGTTYPIPLPAWADVRVDTNPGSPAVVSVMADAERHDRWHPVGDGYRPQPGDWVLFNHHVEVVTRYAGGTLDTIGADSDPGLTVNAHSYGGSLADDGAVGFVDNGHLAPAGAVPSGSVSSGSVSSGSAASSDHDSSGSPAHDSSGAPETAPTPAPRATASSAPQAGPQASPTNSASAGGHAAGASPAAAPDQAGGQAVVPGLPAGQAVAPGPAAIAGATSIPGVASAASAAASATADAKPASPAHHSAAAGAADVPGVVQPAGTGSGGASAGGGAGSATRSGSQSVEDRGAAAAIPGSAPAASVGSGTSRSGAAAVPGASPGGEAPATHPVATPSARPSSPAAHPSATGSAAPEQYKQHTPPSQATPGTRVQQAFINLIAPGAVSAQARWGVPAAVTIAQAIEESSWGNSSLASEYHNLFGIKGSGPAGSVGLPTDEFYGGHWVSITAQFRVYHNVAESIADHAELLATSGYYQRAMADRAIPDAFANDLTGVYATDPDYGANLIAIMKLYNLYRFDAPAQAAQPAQSGPAHPAQPQSAPATATPTPAASPASVAPAPSPSASATQPGSAQPSASASASAHGSGGGGGGGARPEQATGAEAAIPGLGAPTVAPSPAATGAGHGSAAAHQPAAHQQVAHQQVAHQQVAQIPGMQAPAVGGAGSSATNAQSGATAHAAANPQAAPSPQATAAHQAAAGQAHGEAAIPGLAGTPASTAPATAAPATAAPAAAATSANYQRQPGTGRRAARYQPQFTTAVTTAYFANAKGPLGHGEHLYRDVAGQTGIRWELLAACDWMQCKANPRLSPVHGEKIGALNSDGTSYATKSAALGQCADDLIELAAAVYGIDLTARRVLSVRALADAFAAFRWGALLLRHGVSAMEFPYAVAGLTAQHQKMHWPAINDPAAPDRPGARFREPFGAVPVVLSLDYPATVLTDRKRRQPCSGSSPGSADAGPRPAPSPPPTVSR